ncbi:MAG: hypothetical protein QOH90_552, partial [Actinomycetota bacterium]|nr:hypothetical protein [Actinomycetota bacterium]
MSGSPSEKSEAGRPSAGREVRDQLKRDEMLEAVAGEYARVTSLVSSLSDADMLRATRCETWSVADLLFHMLGDADRALIAFASPTDEPADVDFASYWAPFKPGGEDAVQHARHIRVGAAAYARPQGIVDRWRVTSEAAIRAAKASPHGRFTTQGHVLEAGDFLATLA